MRHHHERGPRGEGSGRRGESRGRPLPPPHYRNTQDLPEPEGPKDWSPTGLDQFGPDRGPYGQQSGFGNANRYDQSYGQQYYQDYTNQGYQGAQSFADSTRPHQGTWNQDYQQGPRNFNQGSTQGSIGWNPGYVGQGSNDTNPWAQGAEGYGGDMQHYSYFNRPSYQQGQPYQQTRFFQPHASERNWEGNTQQAPFGPQSSFGTEGSLSDKVRSYVGKGPKGFKRSDERIKEDISEALTRHPEIDATDVEINVKNGDVTLTGSVPERRMKHLTEDLADQCLGVKDIINQLRVKKEAEVTEREADTANGAATAPH